MSKTFQIGVGHKINETIVHHALLTESLNQQLQNRSFSFNYSRATYSRTFKDLKDAIQRLVETYGLSLLYDFGSSEFSEKDSVSAVYYSGELVVVFDGSASQMSVHASGRFLKQVEDVIHAVENHSVEYTATEDLFYMLSQSPDGLYFNSVGSFSLEFSEDNYTDEVVIAHMAVANNLMSKEPMGRIVVINGIPGTGKTSFIRSLPKVTRNCKYLYIPSSYVGSLGDPQIIQAISNIHTTGRSLVFIIEDGDMCIVKRAGDNMSAVSSLLNWGDGILAQSFNTHFLITSNAKKVDIDPAIMRNGRLFKHIAIDALPAEKANALMRKLLPDVQYQEFTKGTSLADVYAAAKELGYVART